MDLDNSFLPREAGANKTRIGTVAAGDYWSGKDQRESRRMIRKLATAKYRLYSRKKNPKTGRRRNLGTFGTRAAAEKHERAVQYFKRH
jgi:hypothetical protein